MSKWKHDTDAEFDAGTHNDTEADSDELGLKPFGFDFLDEDCVDDSDWSESISPAGHIWDNGDDASVPLGEIEFYAAKQGTTEVILWKEYVNTLGTVYSIKIRPKRMIGATGRSYFYIEVDGVGSPSHAFVIQIYSNKIMVDDETFSGTPDWTDYTNFIFVVDTSGGLAAATVKIYQDGVLKGTHTGLSTCAEPAYVNWGIKAIPAAGGEAITCRVDLLAMGNGDATNTYATSGDWKTPIGDTLTEGWTSQINMKYKLKDANYNISKIRMIAKQTADIPADGDWNTPTDEWEEGTDYTLIKDNTYRECQIFYSAIWHTEGRRYFFYRVYMTGDGADTPILDWIEMVYDAIAEIPVIYDVVISDDTPYTYQKITITCSFSTTPDEAYVKIGDIEEDISDGSADINCWNLDAGVQTLYIHSVKDGLSDEYTATVTVTLGYQYEAYDPRKDIRETIGVLDAATGDYYIPVEDKNRDTQKVWIYLFPQEEDEQAFPILSLSLVTATSRMTNVGGDKRTNDVVIDCNVFVPRDKDNIDCVNFMKKVASELYTRIRNNQNDIRLTQYMEMTTVGRDLSALEPATIMRKLFEIFCRGDFY